MHVYHVPALFDAVFLAIVFQESALAGRQVLIGYPGWMDSHGMPWPDRNRDLMAMFRGEATLRATLLKYNVSYITVDWNEIQRDSVSIHKLNAHAYRVATNGRYGYHNSIKPKHHHVTHGGFFF